MPATAGMSGASAQGGPSARLEACEGGTSSVAALRLRPASYAWVAGPPSRGFLELKIINVFFFCGERL